MKWLAACLLAILWGIALCKACQKLGILTYQNKAEFYIKTFDCEKVPGNLSYNHYRFLRNLLDNCSGPVRACGEYLYMKWLAACLLAILWGIALCKACQKLGILTYQNKAEFYIKTFDCEKVPRNLSCNHYRFLRNL